MKNIVKNILYKLGIYDVSRNIIKHIYYPYKHYKMKKNLTYILSSLRTVLSENCEDYWLDHGTLLGQYRSNALIGHDIDLDFGVKAKNTANLKEFLYNYNMILTQQTYVDGNIVMEQYSYKGVGFDIFYYQQKEENIVTYIWLANDYTIPQKESYNKGLGKLWEITFSDISTKDIGFYDCDFRVPVDTAKYLSEHFGDDFMIPNPNWQHSDETNRANVEKSFEVRFIA